MPEETLNVLITVMSEGELHVPVSVVSRPLLLPVGRRDESVRRVGTARIAPRCTTGCAVCRGLPDRHR